MQKTGSLYQVLRSKTLPLIFGQFFVFNARIVGGKRELENELSKDSLRTHKLIQRQISPFMIRRLKQQVAKELPSKIETEIPCILNLEQKKVYRLLAEQGILEYGNNLQEAVNNSPTHVFSLLTRLRQSCCDLRLLPNHKGNFGNRSQKKPFLLQKLNGFKLQPIQSDYL